MYGKDFVVFFLIFKIKIPTYIHPLTRLTFLIMIPLLLKPIESFLNNKDNYEPDLAGLVTKQAV